MTWAWKTDLLPVFQSGVLESFIAAVKLAGDVADHATQDVLKHILNDEDEHIDGIEELQDQISQMTLPIFLTTKVG